MADRGNFGYRLQKADVGLADIAARFDTDINAIWKATAVESSRLRNLTKEEFYAQMRAGDTLKNSA